MYFFSENGNAAESTTNMTIRNEENPENLSDDTHQVSNYVVLGNDLLPLESYEMEELNNYYMSNIDEESNPCTLDSRDICDMNTSVKRNIFGSPCVTSTPIPAAADHSSVTVPPEKKIADESCEGKRAVISNTSMKIDDRGETGSTGTRNNTISSTESTSCDNTLRKKMHRSMPKKEKGKKRYRCPVSWKRNVAKAKKNCGEEYVSSTGKIVPRREMRAPCKSSCRKKCAEKIGHDHRCLMFKKFWGMSSYSRQSAFIGKHVKRIPKKRQVIKENDAASRRTCSLSYSLPLTDNQDVEICKTMFINTYVGHHSIKKVDASEIGTVTPDKRGLHNNRPHKISNDVKMSIKQHIEMFPTVESHYCRARTSKRYLEQGLTIAKMYRLYKSWTDENSITSIGTERQYREIFNREYNISFWVPKKDMCDTCYKYNNNPEKNNSQEQEQMDHIRNKEIVRKLKDGDKEKAEVDKSISVSCFDLQKVILVPQCERPPFYYKCKLSTYNFTVFDVNSKEGFCYIWTEQIAKRGGNEIASCLFDFIETMVKRDNCIGQNKNKILVMMYLFATKKFQIEIVHRFFEAGHSQNENDSIHALIERNKQGKISSHLSSSLC
nr:unnamed protein product [Callosobruchus analis]